MTRRASIHVPPGVLTAALMLLAGWIAARFGHENGRLTYKVEHPNCRLLTAGAASTGFNSPTRR
jgi:hypothetical protein